jgi:polyphosphate kinase 2 (PPK2 family)
VLVVRVHPDLLAAEHLPAQKTDVWAGRYREINDWERYLAGNGIHVVKVMLDMSKQEQDSARSTMSTRLTPRREELAKARAELAAAPGLTQPG